MATSLSIQNRTRRTAPRAPFARAALRILPGWEVSLVFVEPAEAKRLNVTLRKKTYVPNVLSYEAGAKHGEVIICLSEAKKQAPDYGMREAQFVLFLFIHGCLHLKGYPHGATMERRERKLLAELAKLAPHVSRSTQKLSHVTTHRHRNRHRNLPGKTGGGRRGAR